MPKETSNGGKALLTYLREQHSAYLAQKKKDAADDGIDEFGEPDFIEPKAPWIARDVRGLLNKAFPAATQKRAQQRHTSGLPTRKYI